MKVFKFGGASVNSAERIKNVGNILKKYDGNKILIVISAMGKTTNALEKVAEAFFNKEKEKALDLFNEIKEQHLHLQANLMGDTSNNAGVQLKSFFTEIEWLLHDAPVREFNYYYDQIVCIGEILSSFIVSQFLNSTGIPNAWRDVRDVIRTDNNFRDARIDWDITKEKIDQNILPLFQQYNIIITQGFIGSTDENESTTLGREGSDFSAAIFSNLLNAESQTIWKDVQGVMNADPKQYEKAQWIQEMSYNEVIEMAYYGAQVIHPKTIKPLQNKNIPLHVKSFIEPDAQGTIIHNKFSNSLPPIIVYKEKQVLLQFTSKDFSFVSEGLTTEVYEIFDSIKFKPNLTQNAAISLLCVTDDVQEKVELLALSASQKFNVTVTKDLFLLTIRHYNDDILSELIKGKKTVLRQQTPETIQVLMQS